MADLSQLEGLIDALESNYYDLRNEIDSLKDYLGVEIIDGEIKKINE